jgi:hypothetical protein
MALGLKCSICGDRGGIVYRSRKRQMLCDPCDRKCPDKISRAEFDARFYDNPMEVGEPVKMQDYKDYLFSIATFDGFKLGRETYLDGRTTRTT